MLNVKKLTKNVINNLFQLLNCITFMVLILLAAMNNLSLKQESKWYLLYYYAKWVKSFYLKYIFQLISQGQSSTSYFNEIMFILNYKGSFFAVIQF